MPSRKRPRSGKPARLPPPEAYVAWLVHDLRTPLATIRMASRLLVETRDPSAIAEAHEAIEQQSARMAQALDDLAALAEATAGTLAMRRAPVELAALARRVAARMSREDGARDARVGLALPGVPVRVVGDAALLERVIAALLRHATSAKPRRSAIALSLDVEAARRGRGACARLRVRGPRTTRGLGLALAECLVVLQGGRYDAVAGRITVRLPLRPSPAPRSGR